MHWFHDIFVGQNITQLYNIKHFSFQTNANISTFIFCSMCYPCHNWRIKIIHTSPFKEQPDQGLKTSSIFYWPFFCGSFLLFMFHISLYYAVLSFPCSLVITCWERADLLPVLHVMFLCFWSLSYMVSRFTRGNWLYWFLIFAIFLTLLS